MLSSAFRRELEAHFGELFFRNLEIAARTFKPEIIGLMQEENALVSEYQALYASMTVKFDGKTLPITKLSPYKQSTDRAVRRAAYAVEGECFDSHKEKLDALYDKLVKTARRRQRRSAMRIMSGSATTASDGTATTVMTSPLSAIRSRWILFPLSPK